MKFDYQSSQRGPRLEVFKLVCASVPTGTAAQTATGCTEGTYQCTVLKNGTGDYTVNFNNTFSRSPVASPTPMHATSKLFATIVSTSTSATRVIVHTDGGTATDPTELHIFVAGFATTDQI